MKNLNVKNQFDQTRAGQFQNDADPVQNADLSAKTKLIGKRKTFNSPIGKTGFVRNANPVQLERVVSNKGTAAVTDFKQIKISGRR